ncbi:hypothetical protein [Streptomyces sp. NRRL S-350]|uniref:hypothetical protein n=1 Tax=Streptomyces sp. NRRL S-350 TaxID=1463902 RepID=UPI0004C1BD60|nr:hypothetical protein [Streptomyces sp. NRRL S-350]
MRTRLALVLAAAIAAATLTACSEQSPQTCDQPAAAAQLIAKASPSKTSTSASRPVAGLSKTPPASAPSAKPTAPTAKPPKPAKTKHHHHDDDCDD